MSKSGDMWDTNDLRAAYYRTLRAADPAILGTNTRVPSCCGLAEAVLKFDAPKNEEPPALRGYKPDLHLPDVERTREPEYPECPACGPDDWGLPCPHQLAGETE